MVINNIYLQQNTIYISNTITTKKRLYYKLNFTKYLPFEYFFPFFMKIWYKFKYKRKWREKNMLTYNLEQRNDEPKYYYIYKGC